MARSLSVISSAFARDDLASEGARPAEQPVDPVARLEIWKAFACLKLAVLPNRHPKEPRHPANADPPPVPVAFEHQSEADHESGA